MEKKNRKISAGVRRYYKKKKFTHKIKMIVVSILMIAGLLTAGYQGAMKIKFGMIIAQAESIDAITQEEAKEIYERMIGWDILDKSAVILITIKGAATPAPDLTVREQIIKIAEEQNFKYTDYLVRLAKCESNFNPKATNLNGGHSLDVGLFQWNMHYHPEISIDCALDIRCATLKTIEAINAGNQGWWVCDDLI